MIKTTITPKNFSEEWQLFQPILFHTKTFLFTTPTETMRSGNIDLECRCFERRFPEKKLSIFPTLSFQQDDLNVRRSHFSGQIVFHIGVKVFIPLCGGQYRIYL